MCSVRTSPGEANCWRLRVSLHRQGDCRSTTRCDADSKGPSIYLTQLAVDCGLKELVFRIASGLDGEFPFSYLVCIDDLHRNSGRCQGLDKYSDILRHTNTAGNVIKIAQAAMQQSSPMARMDSSQHQLDQ